MEEPAAEALFQPSAFVGELFDQRAECSPFGSASQITATFTGPRRKTCKQKKPRGPRLRVQRIVITRPSLTLRIL